MSHVFRTINRYHDQFESYKTVITLKSKIFWISMIAVIAFLYSFFWYVDQSLWPVSEVARGYRLFWVMAFEVLVLVCWHRLQSLRNQSIIERAQRLLKTDSINVHELKKVWFEKTLGIPSTEFLELALKIDQFLDLKDRNRPPLSLNRAKIFNLIFTVDSKNRVLAMFMGICAAFIGLSISAGISINDLFSQLEKENIKSLLAMVVIISFFMMLTYLVSWYLVVVLLTFLSNLSGRLDGLNSTSDLKARAFINQLVKLHELPKGRVSVIEKGPFWFGLKGRAYLFAALQDRLDLLPPKGFRIVRLALHYR